MINIQTNEEYEIFDHFLQNIEEFFSKNGEIIIKKRNIIKKIDYGDTKLVVKSFKIPNIINKFAYRFLRASKAKRSFLNAQKLLKLDINTPLPIGYVEFFNPFFDKSFYICKFFDYDFEIRDVLNDTNFKNRDEIFEEFIKFSYDLHQKGVYHVDYSPGNILVKKENTRYTFNIVDVNRMKFINFTDKLRFKNLSKLSASKDDIQKFAEFYAKISNIDKSFATKWLFFYHNKHQKYLQNKKRLKIFKSF